MKKWQALLVAVVTFGLVRVASGESLRSDQQTGGLVPLDNPDNHPALPESSMHPAIAAQLQSTSVGKAVKIDSKKRAYRNPKRRLQEAGHGRHLASIQCKRKTVYVIDVSGSQASEKLAAINAIQALDGRIDSEQACIVLFATGYQVMGCASTPAAKIALFNAARRVAESGNLENLTILTGGMTGATSVISGLQVQASEVLNVITETDGIVRESPITIQGLVSSLATTCAAKGVICESHGLAVRGIDGLNLGTFNIIAPGNTHEFPSTTALANGVGGIVLCDPTTAPSIPPTSLQPTGTPSVQPTKAPVQSPPVETKVPTGAPTGSPTGSPTTKPPTTPPYVPPVVTTLTLLGLGALALLPRFLTKKEVVEIDNPAYLDYMARMAAAEPTTVERTETTTTEHHEGVDAKRAWTRRGTHVGDVPSMQDREGNARAGMADTQFNETYGIPWTSGFRAHGHIRDGQAPAQDAADYNRRRRSEQENQEEPPIPPAKIAVLQVEREFKGGFFSLLYLLGATAVGGFAARFKTNADAANADPEGQQDAGQPAEQNQSRFTRAVATVKEKASAAGQRASDAATWAHGKLPTRMQGPATTVGKGLRGFFFGEADKDTDATVDRGANWVNEKLPTVVQGPAAATGRGLKWFGFAVANGLAFVAIDVPMMLVGKESAGFWGKKELQITAKARQKLLDDPNLPAGQRAILESLKDEDLAPPPKPLWQRVKEFCGSLPARLSKRKDAPASTNTTPTQTPDRVNEEDGVTGAVQLSGGTELPRPLFLRELQQARENRADSLQNTAREQSADEDEPRTPPPPPPEARRPPPVPKRDTLPKKDGSPRDSSGGPNLV